MTNYCKDHAQANADDPRPFSVDDERDCDACLAEVSGEIEDELIELARENPGALITLRDGEVDFFPDGHPVGDMGAGSRFEKWEHYQGYRAPIHDCKQQLFIDDAKESFCRHCDATWERHEKEFIASYVHEHRQESIHQELVNWAKQFDIAAGASARIANKEAQHA